jgi:hypothetical protein
MPSEIFNIINSRNTDFYIDQVTPLFCRVTHSHTEALSLSVFAQKPFVFPKNARIFEGFLGT